MQYLVEDILEIKCRDNPKRNKKLAAHLVKNIKTAREFFPIDGFSLGETLLVIPGPGVPVIKRLVVLDSKASVRFLSHDLKWRPNQF